MSIYFFGADTYTDDPTRDKGEETVLPGEVVSDEERSELERLAREEWDVHCVKVGLCSSCGFPEEQCHCDEGAYKRGDTLEY